MKEGIIQGTPKGPEQMVDNFGRHYQLVSGFFSERLSGNVNQLKEVTVTGGHVSMANLLKEKHGWDGKSVHVTVKHRLGTLSNTVNTNWLALGSLNPFTVSATDIWDPADKHI